MMKLLIKQILQLVFYLLFGQSVISQDSTQVITGKITNERGEALAGVSIVKADGKGTLSNAQGLFSLPRVSKSAILLVTYIGYAPRRMPVSGRNNITVVLTPSSNMLDQVVIQAYGVTSQRTSTGNISKVTADDIAKQPVINPMQALQGRVPGATVTSMNGHASGTVKIEIRGRNNINPNRPTDPLVLVDGVPLMVEDVSNVQTISSGTAVSQGAIQSGISSPAGGQSPFFNLNPNDIESIEVLKDADATAIYGSRGANGVILITTKRGKTGKATTELNVYTGMSKVVRFFPLLNTQQYVTLRKAALANDGLPMDMSTAPDLVAWDTTRYTDWQRFAFGGTGRTLSAQLSMQGGTALTNFRVSAGYNYQRDITAISGGNQRGSVSMALQHKTPDQRFKLDMSVQYSITSSDLIYTGGSALLPPNAPAIFDSTGALNYRGWSPLATSFPFGSMWQPYKASTNLLTSNLVMSWSIANGLTGRVNMGYNHSQGSQRHTIPIRSLNPDVNPRGSLNLGRSTFYNALIEPQLEYIQQLSKGRLTVLAGATYQQNKTTGLLTAGTNYTNDLLLSSINAAPQKQIVENSAQYKYGGAFMRLSYNWNNRYIINFNGRRDGSSRFAAGRQFGNFGSVGAAWVLSETCLLKTIPAISFAKLRGSYGITGSDQIGDYGFLSLYEFGTGSGYGGQSTLVPVRFADSLLRWEQNRKLELGLQLGLLNDRINVQVSLYRNRCNNQLVSMPIATQSGFATVITNTPANVQNTGVEFNADIKIVQQGDWRVSTKLYVAANRNKLLSYPRFDQSPYKGRFALGRSLNIVRLLHFTGVDPQTGDYQFADLDGDGEITMDITGSRPDDRMIIDMTPQHEAGFTTEISYRQWSLNMLWYHRKQKGYNALVSAEQPGSRTNQPVSVMQYWQKPGDNSAVGKPVNYGNDNSNQYAFYSDGRISDASFIRLQNLSVSYSLPDRWLQKAHLSQLRLYVQGENLAVITDYKGSDPEIQQFGALPRPAIFTAGIACKF